MIKNFKNLDVLGCAGGHRLLFDTMRYSVVGKFVAWHFCGGHFYGKPAPLGEFGGRGIIS